MRKFCCQAVTVVVLVLCSAQVAQSQEDETSRTGVLEWIKKLSGPSMVSAGVQFGFDQGAAPMRLNTRRMAQLRVAALVGAAVDDRGAVTPENSKIYMATLQPSVSIPVARILGRLVDVGVGVAVHGFYTIEPDSAGGEDDIFVHGSIPLVLQTPINVGRDWVIDFGLIGRLFPPFPNSAFEPVDVNVETSSWELTWGLQVSVERRASRRN